MNYVLLGLSIVLALIVLRQKILLERLRRENKDQEFRIRLRDEAYNHLLKIYHKDELVGVSLEKFNILRIPCQSCGKVTEVSSGSLHIDGIPKCWNCGKPIAIFMKENNDEEEQKDTVAGDATDDSAAS